MGQQHDGSKKLKTNRNASMFAQHGAQGDMFSIASSPKPKYTTLKENTKCDHPSNTQLYKKIAFNRRGTTTSSS